MIRAMVPRTILVVASLAAMPATAAALSPSAPPGSSPRSPDAQVLRKAGLRVSWPVGALPQIWRGGQTVTVRVTPLRRRHRSATVSLVRVRRDGRDGRTLARRTLRAGRFSVTLPRALGRRYALRLRVGRRTWSSPIEVRADGTGCPLTGRSSADMTVEPSAGRPDDPVTVFVRNTGETCLSGGGFRWERLLADGTWQPVPQPDLSRYPPVPTILIPRLPGTTFADGAFVWPELDPGPHRIVKEVWPIDAPMGARLTLAASFQVLP
jgi:hypothetical protein